MSARRILQKEYNTIYGERTHRWLERCKAYHKNTEKQSLFGIMQGGMYHDLGKQSAKAIVDLDLPGYAIGGLSVGEPKELFLEILGGCVDYLPDNKPKIYYGVLVRRIIF